VNVPGNKSGSRRFVRKLTASGNTRTLYKMSPPSLVDICKKVVFNNIQQIHSFGEMPPPLYSEFLRAVKSAHHLHELETNTPEEIYDYTPTHWRRIIAKDFPKLSKENGWVPSNPKSWYKVWKQYDRIQKESDAEATAILTQKLAAQQNERDMKRTQFVTLGQARRLDLPKLGAGVLRSSSFGFSSSGSSASGSGSSHWSAQPRPKATPLSRVRSQVKAEAKRLKLATPTGSLPVRSGQIIRAPDSFIRDKRVERQFDPAATLDRGPVMPGTRTVFDVAERAREKERKEREARLLRIKGASKPAENVVSFDDDDDDDDDGGEDDEDTKGSDRSVLDDLFGELEAGATSPTSASPPPSAPNPRRRGLLSAAPGSSVTRIAASPPAARTSRPSHTSPPPKSLPRPENRLQSPPPALSPPFMQPLKRKEVDIFMRPKKRVRR
jgi:elongin-A